MQLVSEQEGKIRDDIWFPVFPCYLNNDLPSRTTEATMALWIALQELINISAKTL